MQLETRQTISDLVDRGAVFFLNDSGGKDSQAMKIIMSKIVPVGQLVTIYAYLPGVDWKGTCHHSWKNKVGDWTMVQAGKSFFEMVYHRQMWPSPKNRQCTSDLKRGPIEKAIRHYSKRTNKTLIVNCMGLRAEESSGRAKAEVFKFNKRNSKAGREWYDLLPIHKMLIGDVFLTIKDAGQDPHWAYGAGMSRLSCCFCIMASKKDLTLAAKLNPAMYRRYVETEKEIDQTLMMPGKKGRKFLEEITGIKAIK